MHLDGALEAAILFMDFVEIGHDGLQPEFVREF
jgi:hypothetical protein